MANKKEHGNRNRDLAKQLFEQGVYFDWTITVCFYSVIHIVEASLLPTEINGTNCRNIEDVKKAVNKPTLHSSRSELIKHKKRSIFAPYKWLDDNSRNARYKTFKINKQQAQKAIEQMDKIFTQLALENE